MSSATHSYRTHRAAGVALVGAGLAAATAVGPVISLPESPLARAEVRLTDVAGDLLGSLDGIQNVPLNLITDIVNIPYYLFDAPYSAVGLVPNVTDGFDSAIYPPYGGPADGISNGALNNLANALLYTGSWWQSSATNVWGWDTANPWNFTALINTLIPIKPLSEPLADNLNTIMAAEFPIAEHANRFLFNDILGELQTLFKVPLSDLTSGYTFDAPPQINPVGIGASPIGDGGTTYPEIWSGTTKYLDPSWGLGFGHTQAWSGEEVPNFLQSLTQPWSPDDIKMADPQSILPTFWNVYNSFNSDFSPFYLGTVQGTDDLIPGTDSFVFQGAKYLYGLPNVINGIFNGVNGGIFGSDFPDVLPPSLTSIIGDPLNWLIGPNSEFANGAVNISNFMLGLVSDLELLTGGPGVPGIDPVLNLANYLPDVTSLMSGLDMSNLFSGFDLSNLFSGLDLTNFLSALDLSAFLPDLATTLGPDLAANMAGAIDPMTFLSLLF